MAGRRNAAGRQTNAQPDTPNPAVAGESGFVYPCAPPMPGGGQELTPAMKVMDAIAAILQKEGVEHLVGYPNNRLIDACAAIGIRPLIARTERVAINIADGFSRMAGGRRICAVAIQHGPGLENGYGAIAQAFADGTPMLILPGGYDSRQSGTEVNFSAVENLRRITKWVTSINHPERTPQILQRAFGKLRSGKPGPVVVEVPVDVMVADAAIALDAYASPRISRSLADPAEVARLADRLLAARRPLIVAGQGVLYAEAADELRHLAELTQVAVMTSLAGKSAFPEDHPLALGTGGLARPRALDHFLEHCDYALGIGTSFTRSLYSAQPPAHVERAQITNAPEDVGISDPVSQALIGDLRLVLRQLIEALAPRVDAARRADRRVAAEIAALKSAFLATWLPRLTASTTPISPYRVVWELMQAADRRRTVVTHDSGNPRDQTTPFYEAIVPHGYLGWGKSTQLGTGLGLAIGAKLARPDWLSVNIMGDAAFGMVGLDLESAVRLGIPTLTIVLNNGLMGGYSGYLPIASARYQINRIGGNRYAAIARELGVFAQRVTEPGDLGAVLRRAIRATEAGQAALVEVITREEADVPGYDAT